MEVRQIQKGEMKKTIVLLLMINLTLTGYCQSFKFLKPTLTDSTKVVKTEIDTKSQFERVYFIDYSGSSKAKSELADFGLDSLNPSESIGLTYNSILKNLKTRPGKVDLNLPEKWVKLFKYKGDWILFDDIPKYILTDSCLITFQMDDPVSDVIAHYRPGHNKYELSLLSYNWENPEMNLTTDLEIKVLDSKKHITLWRFTVQGQVTYEILVPVNHVSHFPVMVMLETDLMDDEYDIFDKIDYEKYWNK